MVMLGPTGKRRAYKMKQRQGVISALLIYATGKRRVYINSAEITPCIYFILAETVVVKSTGSIFHHELLITLSRVGNCKNRIETKNISCFL